MRVLHILSVIVAVALVCVGVGFVGSVAADEIEDDEELDELIDSDPDAADDDTVREVVDYVTANAGDLNESTIDTARLWIDRARGDRAEPINATEIEQQIDSETAIVGWSYSDGQFTVEFHAERPTSVSVAESGAFSEGSGEFAFYERNLPAGESVETFRVVDEQGAALTFATPQAQQENRGAYISTGGEADDPFRHFGGADGLVVGVIMTTALAALGAGIVIYQEESGVIEA